VGGGGEVMFRIFLTSVLDGGKWSASHHSCVWAWYPLGNGQVDPTVGLDTVTERKVPYPFRDPQLVTTETKFLYKVMQNLFSVNFLTNLCVVG
jgi:hypothetical protein